MRPWFEIIGSAFRLRTSGSPEVTGTLCPGLSKLYSIPDLLETTPGSGVYDHWTGRPPFSYWWEFLSAWGIIPGSNPRSLTLRIGGINYPVVIYEYDEDTTLSGSIGNSTNDSHGVVVICHGKLTLSNVTTAARKRGLFIWGDEVVGTANMTQKGAHATGQNLYLYPGVTVPAAAGIGGTAYAYRPDGHSGSSVYAGPNAGTAPSIGCGGGFSGKAWATRPGSPCDPDTTGGTSHAYAGQGGRGTSYCGGAGGGGIMVMCYANTGSYTGRGENGSGVSTGGQYWQADDQNGKYNPYSTTYRGSSAGGGLLVVTGRIVSGTFTALGGNSSHSYCGNAGGGCVVALANEIGSVSKSVGNGGYLIQEV